jgi:alpha-D-ribose 1-methylphosphonate 5-triphosphate synthase subunit PhnI
MQFTAGRLAGCSPNDHRWYTLTEAAMSTKSDSLQPAIIVPMRQSCDRLLRTHACRVLQVTSSALESRLSPRMAMHSDLRGLGGVQCTALHTHRLTSFQLTDSSEWLRPLRMKRQEQIMPQIIHIKINSWCQFECRNEVLN